MADPPVPDPPGSAPGPPVGEPSRSPGAGGSVVHSPSTGHSPFTGHSPSTRRPGSGVSGGRVVLVHGFTQTLRSWGPVAAFLERWLAGPLFATLPAEAAGRDERLANTPEGLASALRRLGTGAQEPLWDRLATLGPPALLVAGALDAKFAAIAREMAAAIGPAAELVLVGGAGHAVHLERPAELAELVEEFLAATLGGPPAA